MAISVKTIMKRLLSFKRYQGLFLFKFLTDLRGLWSIGLIALN